MPRDSGRREMMRFRASKSDNARWLRAAKQRDMTFSEFVRFAMDTVAGVRPGEEATGKPQLEA